MRPTLSVCGLIIAFLLTRSSNAQHLIDLRSVRLGGEGWAPDPLAHSLIVDSVIFCGDPSASLGLVMKGVGNRPVSAFIKGDARAELKALLDRLRTAGDDGRHVTLKVDTLEISERTMSTKEMAYCRFAGEVIERADSGWTALYAFGTTLATRGGMDATDDHAVNIAHAVDNCLRRTVRAIGSLEHQRRTISDRQLHRPYLRRMGDIRSIQDTLVAKGIYYSYMDFVDHTPDTTTAFKLKESVNATELTRVVKVKGAEWDMQAWGISDGERLYVNTGREYNEVTIGREGLHTYWTPYGGEARDAVELMAIGFMFGVVGLALAGSGEGDTPVRLDIDLITGSLSRTHTAHTDERNSEHWFSYSRHSNTDTATCLFMYGGEEACLRKGQHHVVRLVPRIDPVPLELRVGEQHVQVELDTNASTDQVYLLSVKSNGTLKVDKVNGAMANGVLEKLDPENEVK
jgi:hypothetical protein